MICAAALERMGTGKAPGIVLSLAGQGGYTEIEQEIIRSASHIGHFRFGST